MSLLPVPSHSPQEQVEPLYLGLPLLPEMFWSDSALQSSWALV